MSISDKPGENAGEASMDEILASIRKIIADDPAASKGGADRRSTNPLLEPSTPSPRGSVGDDGDGPLLPPAPRFEDALRAGSEALRLQAEATSHPSRSPPPPPSRGQPFADRALADLLSEGLDEDISPGRKTTQSLSSGAPRGPFAAAPATAQRAAPGASSGSDPWAAWRNLRNAAVPGAANSAASDPEPINALNQNASDAPIAGHSNETEPTPSAATPPSRPNFGAPVELTSEAQSSALSSEPAAASFNGYTAINAETGEEIPAEPAAKTSSLDKATTASPGSNKPGFYPPLPSTVIRRQAPSFSSVFPRGAGPAADAAPASSPKAAASSQDVGERNPLERSNTSHLNGHALPASSATLSQTSSRAEQATAAAANQALEKLAAGLSEAAPSVPGLQPSPVSQMLASATPAPTPLQAPAAAAPVPSGGPRTLDDMVSDLLRPMLEKWVESNMPRLMEKALRPGPAKDPNHPKS